jgi:hypothetical protein
VGAEPIMRIDLHLDGGLVRATAMDIVVGTCTDVGAYGPPIRT